MPKIFNQEILIIQSSYKMMIIKIMPPFNWNKNLERKANLVKVDFPDKGLKAYISPKVHHQVSFSFITKRKLKYQNSME